MVSIIQKRVINSDLSAIYLVETGKAGYVYMRVARKIGVRDRAVVVVDAEKLLAAWQRHPHFQEPLAFADEAGWRNDYKFHRAEEGFSRGISDPVPLAITGTHLILDGSATSVGFTNGITRTIWLLANKARIFPVECNSDEASTLFDAVGAPEFSVSRVEALLTI